jgi:hypothetical protein
MSEASKSQIVFARAVVRFAAYQFVVNCLPIGWALWAFVIGMPDGMYWSSLWGMLALYVAATFYLIWTILWPAINRRIAERDREKG